MDLEAFRQDAVEDEHLSQMQPQQLQDSGQILETHVLPPYELYKKYKVRYYYCAFLLCPLLLSPAVFLLFKFGLSKVTEYKLLEAVQRQAWVPALAQVSILAALTLLSWTSSQAIAVLVPYSQLRYRKKLSKSSVRSLTALLHVRDYFSRALFLFLLLFLLAGTVYDTTILQNALQTVSKRVEGNTAAGTVALADLPKYSFVFYLERLHICAVIFATAFLLFKYLLHVILYSFHTTTFGQRIQIANRDLQLLSDFYKVVAKEETRFMHGLQDDQLNLSSEHRAATIAKVLFESLAQGRESIPAQEVTCDLFLRKNAAMGLEDFVEGVTRLYRERMNIRKSLKSNRNIMHKLDRMLSTIASVLSALLCTPFLDIGVTTLWAGFLALFTALGFALQSVGRTSFEAILFIFVVHSFDIGDVVVIDGEQFVVEHLEVFTSEFRRVQDATIVYAPNSALSNKNITNISRTEREQRATAFKI